MWENRKDFLFFVGMKVLAYLSKYTIVLVFMEMYKILLLFVVRFGLG